MIFVVVVGGGGWDGADGGGLFVVFYVGRVEGGRVMSVARPESSVSVFFFFFARDGGVVGAVGVDYCEAFHGLLSRKCDGRSIDIHSPRGVIRH